MNNLRESNTYFSKLSKKEIIELLEYIKDFKYDYVSNIGLDNDLGFGIEIESERGFNNTIRSYMINNYKAIEVNGISKDIVTDYTKWQVSNDGSLSNGIELSSPILSDNKVVWDDIKKICELLERCGASATERCGAHIHYNASYLLNNYENLVRLIKIYTVYENILIKFGYGLNLRPRQNLFTYAPPTSKEFYEYMELIKSSKSLEELSNWLPRKKNSAINLKNINWDDITSEKKNTIEFRSPNGTTNYIIWQNLINTYGHLFMCSKKKIDDEFLEYKLDTYYKENYKCSNFYINIYLKEALEFVDMIFDNNYDKVMFLKQYLNNF